MNNNFVNKLKEIMSNPGEMNISKLEGFVEETVRYFKELQEVMKSGDEEKKSEALKQALEVKAALEAQMGAISKMTGLTPDQMMAAAVNSSSFDENQWKVIENARKKLMGGGQAEPVKAADKPFVKIIG